MKTKVLLLFALLTTTLVAAQAPPVPVFPAGDTRAKRIGPNSLKKILNQNWVEHQKTYYIKGRKRAYNTPNRAKLIRLNSDSTYWESENTGSWNVHNGNLFIIELNEDEEEANDGSAILGIYALYKINKNEMVLAKALTRDFQNKIVYHFKRTNDKFKARDGQPIAQRLQARGINFQSYIGPKVSEEELKGRNHKELMRMVRSEYFQRRKPEPKGLESYSKERLIKVIKAFYK